MSGESGTIRSYQRVFRPERRIYSVEGRALPVPGGIPLRWLACWTGGLLFVLLLGTGSGAALLIAGACGAAIGLSSGGASGAALGAGSAALSALLAGFLLGALDWPLRLVVVPALVATLASQATPDGRRAERFALSWIRLRLGARRRSLGRELPALGEHARAAELWVEGDESGARLRRARVHGPASVAFAEPVDLRAAGGRRRSHLARRLGWHARRGSVADHVELAAGESLEIRP
jgi:hypothetical protein